MVNVNCLKIKARVVHGDTLLVQKKIQVIHDRFAGSSFLKIPAQHPNESHAQWRDARIHADKIVRKKILKKPRTNPRGAVRAKLRKHLSKRPVVFINLAHTCSEKKNASLEVILIAGFYRLMNVPGRN